eukprot:scaffold98349_cov18-Tisochrysis_lutea.AAC.2
MLPAATSYPAYLYSAHEFLSQVETHVLGHLTQQQTPHLVRATTLPAVPCSTHIQHGVQFSRKPARPAQIVAAGAKLNNTSHPLEDPSSRQTLLPESGVVYKE